MPDLELLLDVRSVGEETVLCRVVEMIAIMLGAPLKFIVDSVVGCHTLTVLSRDEGVEKEETRSHHCPKDTP